jgi:hypothetical protein
MPNLARPNTTSTDQAEHYPAAPCDAGSLGELYPCRIEQMVNADE